MTTWNISWRFGIFYDHLVHFVFIWYIFSGFGTKKNLATLVAGKKQEQLENKKVTVYKIQRFLPVLFCYTKQRYLRIFLMAGFDLTTHRYAGGDDTTRPRRHGLEKNSLPRNKKDD
jgi:hypothetical protein